MIKNKRYAENFRYGLQRTKDYLYKWGKNNGYFYDNPSSYRAKKFFKMLLFSLPLIIFEFLTLSYDAFLNLGNKDFVFVFGIIGTIATLIGALLEHKKKIFGNILILSGILLVLLGIYTTNNIFYPLGIVFLIINAIIIVTSYSNVYTEKGIEKLKYILGFKEFVMRVEKEKIKRFLNENPEYLDKVLPYAVLFGAKHWLDVYNELNNELNRNDNKWYGGTTYITHKLFDELGNSLSESIDYKPENKNNGYNGGGSVGSGAGGGGGGSW